MSNGKLYGILGASFVYAFAQVRFARCWVSSLTISQFPLYPQMAGAPPAKKPTGADALK